MRRTGKTQRILESAIRSARDPNCQQVVIVSHTAEYALQLAQRIQGLVDAHFRCYAKDTKYAVYIDNTPVRFVSRYKFKEMEKRRENDVFTDVYFDNSVTDAT